MSLYWDYERCPGSRSKLLYDRRFVEKMARTFEAIDDEHYSAFTDKPDDAPIREGDYLVICPTSREERATESAELISGLKAAYQLILMARTGAPTKLPRNLYIGEPDFTQEMRRKIADLCGISPEEVFYDGRPGKE